MKSNRTRIQNALIAAARQAEFYAVSYDPETELSPDADVTSAMLAEPATVLANETGSAFVLDARMGRRLARRRASWRFNLMLEFDREVSVEFFENSLLDGPIKLGPVPEDSLPNVIISLVSSSVTHPPRQQPASGTKAVFTFEAELGRI